uniref:DUF5641 domain-containing protein n=1 Tax=Cacopsylla melanoneura TaxID=428564 RepID=A0A8D9E484_9HEMI
MYSDNESNFVGANNSLQDMYKLFQQNDFQKKLHDYTQTEQLTWHFIPPHSPHMGGLWEAGIKSTKFHLKRIVGEHKFTYEQWITLITQVESTLNSRPLYAASEDPKDYVALTPGHFLIGSSFRALPDRESLGVPSSNTTLTNKFRLIQQLYQQFWTRWTREYLNTLQQRNKWRMSAPNVVEGMLVLVIDDNLPPLQWKMARIEECLPSKDDLVRKVSLKFPNGGKGTRAVSRVCILPLEEV